MKHSPKGWIAIAATVGAVFAFLLAAPLFTLAQNAPGSVAPNPSTEELQKQIEALLSQVQAVAEALARQNPQATPVPPASFCHVFTTNLLFNNENAEVGFLYTAMIREGLVAVREGQSVGGLKFDTTLLAAVKAFQEKYRSEILTPYGLTEPTGYVGFATRTKLNQLYGCSAVSRPSITSVSPASVLNSSNELITIYGSNLENTNRIELLQNGVIKGSLSVGEIAAGSRTYIQFRGGLMISNLAAGSYEVRTVSAAGTSNAVNFTITGAGSATNQPSITPGRTTVNSGEDVMLQFTSPEKITRKRFILRCPPGVTASNKGAAEACNTWQEWDVNTNFVALNIKNSSTSEVRVVPNFYIYTGVDPNKAVGISGEITVRPTVTASQPSITVLSPSSGNYLAKGFSYTITWTTAPNQNLPRVKIGLRSSAPGYGQTEWGPGLVANTGSYTWTVPDLDAIPEGVVDSLVIYDPNNPSVRGTVSPIKVVGQSIQQPPSYSSVVEPKSVEATIPVGTAYKVGFVGNPAFGFSGTFNWTLSSGSLPPGISLNKIGAFAGQLSGTPTQVGTYRASIRASDVLNSALTVEVPVTIIVTGYSSPTYSIPTYSAPTYSIPTYSSPTYSSPTYSSPTYSSPTYSTPTYSSPTYSSPTYSNSTYVCGANDGTVYGACGAGQSCTLNLSTVKYSCTSAAGSSTYSSPTYSSPTYSSPTYSSPTYSSPTYSNTTYFCGANNGKNYGSCASGQTCNYNYSNATYSCSTSGSSNATYNSGTDRAAQLGSILQALQGLLQEIGNAVR